MNVRHRYQARREAASLSPAWRWLLEEGTMPGDSLLGPGDDVIDLYRAWHPRSRAAEPRWREWGRLILREWKAAGHPGRPWGAERFGEPGSENGNGGGKP